MKKFLTFVFTFTAGVFFNTNVHAILPDFTPLALTSSQFCAQCISADIPLVLSYVEQVKDMKEKYQGYMDTSFWKQKLKSYASRLGGIALGGILRKFNKREKFLSYTRSIKDASVTNLSNETDVQQVYVKLFFQYPSAKPSVMTEYEGMGKQFQIDSVIEAIVAAKAMGKEVAQMKEDLDKIEKCLIQGEGCEEVGMENCSASQSGGSAEGEDNSCMWSNATRAAILYDKVMRYNENIVYLMSQYKAVQGINTFVKIRPYSKEKKKKKKENKTSAFLKSVDERSKQSTYAYTEVSASVAFTDQTNEEEEEDDEMSSYLDSLVERDNTLLGNFEKSKAATGFTSGLDGKEDEIAGFNAITEVHSNIESAKRLHNFKQNLPNYRRIFVSYHNMKEYYQKARENFWKSSMCAIKMLDSFYEDGTKAWVGRSCTTREDNLGSIYCRYENDDENPEIEGGTESFSISCPDDMKKQCFVATFDNQGERRGISGYLMDLYDAAKEQDATAEVESTVAAYNETSDDKSYVTVMNAELDEGAGVSKGSLKDGSLYMTAKDNSEGGYGKNDLVSLKSLKNQDDSDASVNAVGAELKDPSLSEALSAEVRKDELLAWTIGKEVAIAVDQDLRNEEGKFASVRNKFPLWNDQVLFYNQYINGKYDNLLQYVDNEPFAAETLDLAETINRVIDYVSDVLPSGVVVQTVEQIRKKHAAEIEQARQFFAALPDRSEGIDTLLQEQDNVLDSEIENEKRELEKHYAERARLYEQLKTVNESLSDLRDEYNNSNKTIETSDVNIERSGEGIDYGEKLYANRELSERSPQDDNFIKTKEFSATTKQIAYKNQAEIKKDMIALEEQAKSLKGRLETLKQTINKQRSLFVKSYSEKDMAQKKKFNKQLQKLVVSSQEAREEMRKYGAKNQAILLADKAVECVREYAKDQINTARKEIFALGNDIYYPHNANRVQSIHKKLMNNLMNISADNLPSKCNVMAQFAEAMNRLNIKDPMQPAYDIFKNLCKDGICLQTDDEYYLSFLGRKRDFMAPKEAVDFASAPLREVFHFDMIDYSKVDKYVDEKGDPYSNKSITITAESFLDSGLDIPEIWHRLLSRHSFVERGIDLEELFGRGNASVEQQSANREFLRSGIYPCELDGQYVDVYKGRHGSSYTLNEVSTDFSGSIGTCEEVIKKNNKVVDKKSLATPPEPAMDSSAGDFKKPISELSTILGYTTDNVEGLEEIPAHRFVHFFNPNKKLTFNEALQNALQIINHTTDIGENPADDALFYMSQRSFLDRNQFGDYLNQYELLTVTKKTMDEIEEHMQEIRDSIMFAIEDTDYTLREDFDLTNEEDYKNIGDILHQQKIVYMNAAKRGLSSIHAQTSNLQEKINAAKHALQVLQKDDNEVVAVSGKEDLDELEESIKTSLANSAVADEYAAAEEESKQNQKELMLPYCAVYRNIFE